MRTALIVLGALAAFIAAAIIFLWSGIYSISATEPHWESTRKIIGITVDRSIKAHSRGIKVPSLEDEHMISEGAGHFHDSCRLCHGAPGYQREPFAKGLYPRPPRFSDKLLQKWSDAQLFWITKNGIKMTGMPAFGVTSDDQHLWAVVAFLKKLPEMQAKDYKANVRAGAHHHGGEAEAEDHGH